MRTSFIAKVIEEVYYSGRIKNASKRLDYKDFLILVKLAKSALMADMYRQQKIQGLYPVLNNFLQTYDASAENDSNGRRFISLPVQVMSMPDNAGVFSVVPVVDGSPRYCDAYIRTEAGSEWMLCNDDSGIGYFIPLQDKIMLMNASDCHKKFQLILMPNDDNANVPDDIGFQIAVNVWKQVMPSRGFPVDKQVDDNPNVDEYLKTKLTSPQTT